MFSFGAKVGVPLTTAYTPTGASLDFSANEQRYTIGPTVEVRLPFHLSFEVDALWRRSSYNVTIPPALNFGGNYAASVGDWQIPFMAKYERGSGPVRPFIDGGVVYRHVSSSFLFGGPGNPSTAGVTVGGGVTLKLPHLRLSPEIRYARWPTPAFTSPYNFVVSTSNQVDLLVGVTF
jgi:hypothetical protein